MERPSEIILFCSICLFPVTQCHKEKEEKAVVKDKECHINIDTLDFTFGITYDDAGKYLVPGEQSSLRGSYLEEVKSAIGVPSKSISGMLTVCDWVHQNFSFQNAGGGMIGKVSVDELFEVRTIYGCHSEALIISSLLRELGFPAIMIETADVQWAYNYLSGYVHNFSGHVMSEIFIDDRWILLDNNGWYIAEYDPLNPYIPMRDEPANAYFVFAKGTDTWDYSKKDPDFTHDQLLFFSDNIYCFEEMFNTIEYIWTN